MAKGGGRSGGGGNGSGNNGLMRFRFFRGLSKLGGGYSVKNDALRRVAVARGLGDVEHLLAVLGKDEYEISLTEALRMVEKESGYDALADTVNSSIYRAGKGYKECNRLFRLYMEAMKEDELSYMAGCTKELKKYCGYTDSELKFKE